jgi:hypothetical protein
MGRSRKEKACHSGHPGHTHSYRRSSKFFEADHRKRLVFCRTGFSPSPKPTDDRLTTAFSLGLLTGNILFHRSPSERAAQQVSEDAVPPPPIPSRNKQLYDADVGTAQQLLKDMNIAFDPANFELDPTLFPTAFAELLLM